MFSGIHFHHDVLMKHSRISHLWIRGLAHVHSPLILFSLREQGDVDVLVATGLVLRQRCTF